jgi:hypothetical protein
MATSGTPASRVAASEDQGRIGYAACVNMVETILVFAGAPLAIYGVVALATLRSKLRGGHRYRPGQPWEYPPQWWSANPAGVAEARRSGVASQVEPVARGGARGSW